MKASPKVLAEVSDLVHGDDLVTPDTRAEVTFWSHQFSEHAELLSMALVHTDLKDRATQLHDEWEEFRQALGGKEEHIALREAYQQCDILRAFKTEVIARQLRGEWVGWVGPGFVDHLREELDFFVNLVSGDLSGRSLVENWCEFIAEHAGTVAQMIDPSQRKLVQQLDESSQKLWSLRHEAVDSVGPELVEKAVTTSAEFDQAMSSAGVGTRKVRGSIPTVLVAHIQREDARMREILASLSLPAEDKNKP